MRAITYEDYWEDKPTPNRVQLAAFNKFIEAIRESGEGAPDEFEWVNFPERLEI